jgi:tetratricopeptide (TPR) repeat protein
MSDQTKGNEARLVPAAHNLACVGAVNPLVARGLADIARGTDPLESLWATALVCLAAGELDNAIRLFDELIQLSPASSFAHYFRSSTWFRKCRFGSDSEACDKAIQGFDEVIRLDPEYTSAYEGRGQAWYCKHDYDKAIKDFDEAIRLFSVAEPDALDDGDDEDTLNGVRRWQAEVFYSRGKAWEGKFDYDKALRDFDEAIRLDATVATFYFARGNAWAGKRDYDKAMPDFDDAIRLDPNVAEFYFGRGGICSKQQDYVEAISDYDEAIRLDSSRAAFFNQRGVAWSYVDIDKAISDFSHAIRLDPSNAEHYQNRAEALSFTNDYDRAIEDFNTAIGLEPEDADHYVGRGKAWHAKKEHARAIDDFDEALVHRKRRLEKLRALKAPEIILENELRMLGRLEDTRRIATRALAEQRT